MSEHDFDSDDELEEKEKVCKYINCDINDAIVITSDDCDDHDDLVEMTNRIYVRGEFDNPPFNLKGDVETNRVVRLDMFKLVITQSSPDFIEITFRAVDINKFVRQILVR